MPRAASSVSAGGGERLLLDRQAVGQRAARAPGRPPPWRGRGPAPAPPPARPPSASAASSTSSGATTRFTSPMASASSARTWRPVRIISLARDDPTRRGSRCVPPATGDDAEQHLGQPEPRVLGAHPEVAGQRQLEPAAESEAVDRGDRRPGDGGQRAQRGGEVGPDGLRPRPPPARRCRRRRRRSAARPTARPRPAGRRAARSPPPRAGPAPPPRGRWPSAGPAARAPRRRAGARRSRRLARAICRHRTRRRHLSPEPFRRDGVATAARTGRQSEQPVGRRVRVELAGRPAPSTAVANSSPATPARRCAPPSGPAAPGAALAPGGRPGAWPAAPTSTRCARWRGHRGPQLVDALRRGRRGLDDLGPPRVRARQVEHLLEVPAGLADARAGRPC